MNKVQAQVLIDAPVQKVWEVLADFGGVYRWAPSVTNSYSTSSNNSGSEASRHCDIAGFSGIEESITEWNEGRDFTYTFTGVGPISEGYSTWSVKPQGDKTLVYTDLRYGLRFGPLGALMNVLFLRRKIEKGLVNGVKEAATPSSFKSAQSRWSTRPRSWLARETAYSERRTATSSTGLSSDTSSTV